MSESGEKTEEPTGKRISKFRSEGNIAQSKDIAGVLIIATSIWLMISNGDAIYGQLNGAITKSFTHIAKAHGPDASPIVIKSFGESLLAYAYATAAFFAVSIAIAVVATVVQTDGNFTTKVFAPKFSKFNPVTGIKRLIISWDAVQQISLSLAKMLALASIFYLVISDNMIRLMTLASMSLSDSLHTLGSIVLRLFVTAILVMMAFAAIDYYFTRKRLKQKMKMTKEEVKDERKQQEGDPEVKTAMRQRMMAIGVNQMLSSTADADVVVVNPTHYAVALAYNAAFDDAPKLLAKGQDHVAMKIREVARERGIPIVADPPVARAVYRDGKIGHAIPVDLYELVARVLAYLYRMKGRATA